ncbi:MAG TPA: hypothetical protein VFM74_05680 [Candidatus Limnocylindria bacterium]|nr:hypothetical protein [Candidatus Limnocylindria bacterium]
MSGEEARSADELAGHADALISAASASGAPLRLMGGVAVRLRSSSLGGIAADRRLYHDIDLVTRLRDVRAVDAAFLTLGYEPDRQVNAQFGTVRRVYYHPDGFHADLFFEKLEFCHTIDLSGRLSLDGRTLSPTDLLLGKLQIVERNEKDLIDAAWLLLNHEFGTDAGSQIQLSRVAELTGGDWGWFTTAGDFVAAMRSHLPALGLDAGAAAAVSERLNELEAAMRDAPKSLKWRARERVGRRVRWYRVMEEVL